MHDTKPRTVLSLKKATEPAPQPPAQPPKAPAPTPAKKKKRPLAFACLQAHWPELFDLKQPSPLQIGILSAIVEHLAQAGEPYNEKQIANAIGWHCRRYEYLKALATAPHRVGLNGELSPISDNDRAGGAAKIKSRIKQAKALALAKKST
jgi:sRNA-binding protein